MSSVTSPRRHLPLPLLFFPLQLLLSPVSSTICYQFPDTSCSAGCYRSEDAESGCSRCPLPPYSSSRTWFYSSDGADQCAVCPEVNVRCLCDTTPPENYWLSGHESSPDCVRNGCDNQCFDDVWHMFDSGYPQSIFHESTKFMFVPCECTNEESCEMQRRNRLCFLNDCHRPINGTIPQETLQKCLADYRETQDCSAECYQSIADYLPDLNQCHCHFTPDETHDCSLFYDLFRLCRQPPTAGKVAAFVGITLGILTLVLTMMLYVAARRYALQFGRELKRTGNLSKILPFIDWKSTKLISENHAYRYQNFYTEHEILVKVSFSRLSKFPLSGLFPSQHAVIKIFSNTRTESRNKEISIFRQMKPGGAKDNNIISVYDCIDNDPEDGVSDLISYLQSHVRTFATENMREVINRYYNVRNTSIMMNHCNALSLNSYISTNFPGARLPQNQILGLCKDLARALTFLHGNDPIIIHSDVKPQNIFVKLGRFCWNSEPKFILGDFGFAEVYYPDTGCGWLMRGSTAAFLPPEYMISQRTRGNADDVRSDLAVHATRYTDVMNQAINNRVTMPTTVDIYQVGLIIWLVLHGEEDPYVSELGNRGAAGERDNRLQEMKEMFLNNFATRPRFLDNAPGNVSNDFYKELREIAEQCWHVDLTQRATAAAILDRLESLKLAKLRYSVRTESNRVRDEYNGISLVDVSEV